MSTLLETHPTMPSLEPSSPLRARPNGADSPRLASPHSFSSASSPSSLSSSSSDDEDLLPATIEEDLASDDAASDAADSDGPPEPCERFFVHLSVDGPVINLKRLRARLLHPPRPSTSDASQEGAAGRGGGGGGGGEDVQVTGSRRRRHDDYDKSDPFIDDAEIPAERDDEAMEPVKDGFFVQRGPVAVKDGQPEPRVKREHDGDDLTVKKKRKRTALPTSASASMPAALEAVLVRLEAASMDADVLAQADMPHRRLPDDVNALFSDVIRQYEVEVAGLKIVAERKALLAGLLLRLEAALGMGRPSLRQKMKTLQTRWAAKKRAREIEEVSARLRANVERDVAEHRALVAAHPPSSSAPAPAYKPKWSRLLADVVHLNALHLAQAGAKTSPSGNPLDPDGARVQRELWESLMPCWGGLLDVQALGNRVKASRKARRKKELQREKEKDAAATAAHSAAKRFTEGKPEEQKVEPRAPQSADHSRVEGAGKHTKDKPREPDADRRTAEGRARHEERLKARKEKRRRREALAAAAASAAAASSSAKAAKEAGAHPKKKAKPTSSHSDKGDPKHVNAFRAKRATGSSSSSSSHPSSLPPLSTVFYSPPEPSERWSQRYFPVANPNTVTIGVSGAASTGNPPPWGPSSSAAHNARNKPSSTR